MGSIIINPGCKLHSFMGNYNKGPYKVFSGFNIIPNPDFEYSSKYYEPCTYGGGPCWAGSLLWSCVQTYPSCTPSDSWETITVLDNSQSDIETDFTYERTVGRGIVPDNLASSAQLRSDKVTSTHDLIKQDQRSTAPPIFFTSEYQGQQSFVAGNRRDRVQHRNIKLFEKRINETGRDVSSCFTC